jgi:hypothetical protein
MSSPAPEHTHFCSAVTKILPQERKEAAQQYGSSALGNRGHPDVLCESLHGHAGAHIGYVGCVGTEAGLWLRWDEEGSRWIEAVADCPADSQPGVDGEVCVFVAGHEGPHSFDTDWFAHCRAWENSHEPYRAEREALYAALSSGTGVLGPGPGYWDGTGYWLAGHPPHG